MTTLLLSFLILLNCGTTKSYIPNSLTKNQENQTLKTGWYYLTDKEIGIERKHNKTNEVYFIDPTPIVTVDNFTVMNIYQGTDGNYGLTIKLDDEGTENWRIATGKKVGQYLAFVLNDELFFTPRVNAQIDFGITALNRGDLTEAELNAIKEQIENKKK